MGVGGFSCCSCQNVKKSIYFNENNKNNDDINETNKKIEENTMIQNKSGISDFNNKCSKINAASFKSNELKLDIQQQQDNDEFEKLYNQLSNNTGNN